MAIRIRQDGTMWCAAHTEPLHGDTYIDDTLHYEMSVVHGVIAALPMPDHVNNPQWWWLNVAPPEADGWVRAMEGEKHSRKTTSALVRGRNRRARRNAGGWA